MKLLKQSSIKFLASLLAVIILGTSCASTTVINTVPPGAKVTINGMYAGVTPYTLTDTKPTGASNSVSLSLEGYQTSDVVIVRNEQVDPGAVVGGLFFLFPFIWTMGYSPMHTYELVPSK